MATYTAKIDNGQGGETTIRAETAAEALVDAIEWAKGGDWPEGGCDVDVSVVNEDDEDDQDSDTVHIDSADERVANDEDAAVLGESKGEWTTLRVVRVTGDLYRLKLNGGSRGAYDHRTTPNVIECESVDEREAKRLLLSFGMEPAEVAEAMAE